MTMRTLAAAAIAAFALSAVAADAPQPPRPPEPPDFDFSFSFDTGEILADAEGAKRHAETMRDWAENFASEMQSSMAMVFSDRVGRSKVVKGAPYSAEAVSETNQALADGNVITHKRTSRVYRDSEGRTRQETLRGDAVRSVYIYDPVAGMSYTLLPGSKIAVGVHKKFPRVTIDKDKVVSSDGTTTSERRVVIRRGEKDGDPRVSKEVTVQVVTIGDGDMKDLDIVVPPVPPTPPTPPGAPGSAPMPPVPPVPPIPGVQTMMFHNLGGLGKGTTTSLGTKTLDGVKAEGKQTTWTIPAGQIGNRAPITVTSESWYSPELQVTLYTRYNDPRTGESTYRLAGIRRAEPSPELFTVPADYKVRGKRDRERDRKDGAKEKG
jgi:hypothetical protein